MKHIEIRGYKKSDFKDIINICYKTGYNGEDLSELGEFEDIKLFGYIFCAYYPMYESENIFVAIDKETVVGYIMGSKNSKLQEEQYKKKMIWKIAVRLIFHTIWVHPESYQSVKYFIKNSNYHNAPKNLYEEYPAHFHINILNEYQHMGIGSLLINKFEEYIRNNDIKGVHLRTSNMNKKAIPFYRKNGYELIYQCDGKVWRSVKDYRTLILGKKFLGGDLDK